MSDAGRPTPEAEAELESGRSGDTDVLSRRGLLGWRRRLDRRVALLVAPPATILVITLSLSVATSGSRVPSRAPSPPAGAAPAPAAAAGAARDPRAVHIDPVRPTPLAEPRLSPRPSVRAARAVMKRDPRKGAASRQVAIQPSRTKRAATRSRGR
jgi:hypothetical protein